jgi:aspartyl-tRNA(Asn)/glutamyl-tRNA(Gln) amidotransferase subunit B
LAELAAMTPAEVALVVELGLDRLVAGAIEDGADPRLAVNRAANELAGHLGPAGLDQNAFTSVLKMEGDGRLTATQAKQVIAEMLTEGGDPVAIAEAKAFEALDADALAGAVDAAIAAHPAEAARLRDGEQKLNGFFVGKVMAATGGKADGKAVIALLRQRLS